MKKHLANFITSINLLCGCIGIGLIFNSDIVGASYFIFIAAIFDFLDGFVAKRLHVQSLFGKELDSLADVVSFGVLPGLIMFTLLSLCFADTESILQYLPYSGFLITVFSALRLAKFNIDERQTDHFIGMPTPANAMFIACIPFIILHGNEYPGFITALFGNPGFLFFLVLILSFLLVSSIHLFSLKFKSFGWKENEIRFVFLGIALLSLVVWQFLAVPLIFILYIVLSLIKTPGKNEIPR